MAEFAPTHVVTGADLGSTIDTTGELEADRINVHLGTGLKQAADGRVTLDDDYVLTLVPVPAGVDPGVDNSVEAVGWDVTDQGVVIALSKTDGTQVRAGLPQEVLTRTMLESGSLDQFFPAPAEITATSVFGRPVTLG